MRKLARVSILAALLFGTLVSAADDSKVRLTAGEDKSLIFSVDTKFQTTNVKLFTLEGELIFAEEVKEQAVYSKRFNLKNLEQGEYMFIVENSLKELVYKVEITENSASIISEKENAKPVFRRKDGVVFMNLLNLEEKKVKVKVIDSSDRILFAEAIDGEMLIEKSFNFNKAYKDSYTVVVQDDNNTYYETVAVE